MKTINSHFSSETVSLSGFFKDVTFDRNHFDEVHWLPIDDTIITDLHQRHQILPCAFPHNEFLKRRHVKPLPDQSNHKRNNAIKTTTRRKINVADDSGLIYQRNEKKRIGRQKIISGKLVAKKRIRQAKMSTKRREKMAVMRTENDGLVQAKQNITSMADQYSNTLSGTDLSEEFAIPSTSQSVSSRTRQKSKMNAPEEDQLLSKIQYTVRKSDRIIKPKHRIEI